MQTHINKASTNSRKQTHVHNPIQLSILIPPVTLSSPIACLVAGDESHITCVLRCNRILSQQLAFLLSFVPVVHVKRPSLSHPEAKDGNNKLKIESPSDSLFLPKSERQSPFIATLIHASSSASLHVDSRPREHSSWKPHDTAARRRRRRRRRGRRGSR